MVACFLASLKKQSSEELPLDETLAAVKAAAREGFGFRALRGFSRVGLRTRDNGLLYNYGSSPTFIPPWEHVYFLLGLRFVLQGLR